MEDDENVGGTFWRIMTTFAWNVGVARSPRGLTYMHMFQEDRIERTSLPPRNFEGGTTKRVFKTISKEDNDVPVIF